ncbi:nucleotidyltransferase family protein [Hydrogenophaga palleronii]|uniref:nucleotidyltransferase family protein n=1 Tax=Hydrogenophaga palleronii TaxID=65655 RepID=UPI0014709731|nr:NTP transferase domain-containing protein [Hydrogenophaga palleronii]
MSSPHAVQNSSVACSATILAAGLGRRLGNRPKAALRIGGSSLLERLTRALREAGCDKVNVVVGTHASVLAPLAMRCGAEVLRHSLENPELIDSQRLAIERHAGICPGQDMLLLVADLPLLTEQDIVALLEAWRARKYATMAQVPVVNGVRGHPVILAWDVIRQIQRAPAHVGVREWMQAHSESVAFIESDRTGFVTDLDTPEDFVALRARMHPIEVTLPPNANDTNEH